jgi:hypothetical protein
VSFFNDLRGVIVGELNTILVTKNGGHTWTRIELDDFNSYNYNKVLFSTATSFFIAGNTGVLIEMVDSIEGWVAYKRRISKINDEEDEYVLVDNINDIYKTKLTTWTASYSYSTYSIPTEKDLLFLATDNGNIIAYDINSSFSDLGTDFIYFDFSNYYGDIRSITRRKNTDYFYFTGTDNVTNQDGIFSFDINNFQYLGTGSSYSNTTVGLTAATFEYVTYPNEIFDYDGSELIICGNTSLLQSSTYSVLNFNVLDPTFEEKLKSKLLVLDYDIASKLNFFTDAGDYRLPNSLTFSDTSLVGSYLAFEPLIISATAPSFMTQSETNWITYWSDRQKTFHYYSNTPMNESVTVLMSTDFLYSNKSVLNINTITNNSSDILNLAPTILDDNHSRFEAGLTPRTSPPSYDMYLQDYLMVAKAPFDYSVSIGDVLRLESGVVDGNFIVNEIFTPDSLIPATTDIFAVYDTSSMNISDAATASIQLKNWFSNYCTNNPFYQGSLYILPSGTERWLSIPDLIYTGSLNITSISASPSFVNWDQLSEVISYTQSFTDLVGPGTLSSRYLSAFGSTWSAPDNLIVISFIDESDPVYHGNTFSNAYSAQPTSTYTIDYSQFVNSRSPLTGASASKFSYFKGVVYPIVRPSPSILSGFCAALVLQQVAAINGYTMSQGEIDSTPGIASDYTYGYLGLSFSFITNDITSGWNAGETRINVTPIMTNNPYSSLIDSNGDAGLIQHGWIGFFDKRNRKRVGSTNVGFNPFNPTDFSSDLNYLMDNPSGGTKYLYMFSEFNQNIITNIIQSTSSVTLTNLNRYQTTDELIYRFNEHPIGNAYKLEYSDSYGNVLSSTSSILKMSADFNNLTSYYNLGTNVIIGGNYSEMKYTSGFLNFGYSPTYNLLSYLEGINGVGDLNPTFYATKEYLAMPEYRNIPLGSLTSSTAYIDYNGMTASYDLNSQGNKILFGKDLYLEWNSIFINTFIDVNINGSSVYSTEKLLVMDKYYDEEQEAYVIEFHKRLNFTLGDPGILSGGTLDIISRRRLSQISDDLQELNNIQRTKSKTNSWKDQGAFTYESYENELNFKIPTDSYAKILLSDANTVSKLSAIIYVDYKNELAMNITRLAKEYSIPILNTSQTGIGSVIYDQGKLYISCSQKHELVTGDGVNLEFTGGTGSSQELNQQYFGYHPVIKVTDYDFVVDIDYGVTPLIGNDEGYVRYTRQDPFLNYQPIDLIDYGVDQRGKQSIELTNENLKLSGSVYSLIDIDYNKYRYRLIDGLNLEIISLSYPWILEAEISGAVIGINSSDLIWYKGTWECGRWFGGTWYSGVWMGGDWYGGTWNSNIIDDKILSVSVDTKTVDNERSIWYTGRWYDGTWNNGTWNNGRWYGGTWNDGIWYNGTWNDGTWNDGLFEGGIWVLGTWNTGIFNCDSEPAYWLDGNWNGGDFENGMWYNGNWQQKNGESRFGTKSFNSRTATWQGGNWVSGSFYSKLNINDDGQSDVSDTHKYSIWKTGKWLSGEWYGGIAYNMDWKLGTWYGGILEDIQVIGIDTINNTFTLNGIFKFNIGDDVYIIDNQVGGVNSTFGSNVNPGRYKVLFVEDDTINQTTTIYVNYNLSGTSVTSPTETNLRVVSKFTNLNWKSGIWTNGLFDTGLWEGGIWYNGVFSGTWL